jgi:hypothetical protein
MYISPWSPCYKKCLGKFAFFFWDLVGHEHNMSRPHTKWLCRHDLGSSSGRHVDVTDGKKLQSSKARWIQRHGVRTNFHEDLSVVLQVVNGPYVHGHEQLPSGRDGEPLMPPVSYVCASYFMFCLPYNNIQSHIKVDSHSSVACQFHISAVLSLRRICLNGSSENMYDDVSVSDTARRALKRNWHVTDKCESTLIL